MSGTATPAPTDTRLQHRVRQSMYVAFALLAALALFQAGNANHFEALRAEDGDMLGALRLQRTLTAELGRAAALAPGNDAGAPGAALIRALDRSRAEALVVDAVLARRSPRDNAADGALTAAVAAWQQARGLLWRRCDVLLDALADPAAGGTMVVSAALQAEVDPTSAAVETLTERVRSASRQNGGVQVRMLEYGFVATLLLLLALALLVVEPMARAVARQVRRLADQAAELSRLATVAALTDNRVVITDAERRIEWVNAAFLRGTGYSLDEVLGRNPGELLHSQCNDAAVLQRMRDSFGRGEAVRAELLSRGRNGVEHWLEVDVQPLHDESGLLRGFVSVGTDVTERRRLQEQLRHSARTDALTGLPNRAVVLERVQRALLHCSRHPGYGFAVLFLDFDRFKQVNDSLGHAAGDELLRQIARRIEDTLRPGDAVARVSSQLQTAARIGGDEFVVVLEGVRHADDARTIGMRLLEVLAEPYQVDGSPVQSSASIGIVTSEHAAASADEVLRDADTAMYEAKRAGRGHCVVFDSSMHERVVQALEIESDLRHALRAGELFVVYQPVIDLASGALAGVEALVRWRHPKLGIVPPVRFIGVAEETGLIDAVGREVLQAACRQFARWRRDLGASAPRMLAVNLSRAQLKSPSLVAEVGQVLGECGLQPRELQFEVTESLAAQDERVQATLRQLKVLGVGLALDDFGTGYSSLACLHQLPVDTVKIDRSFVSHAETVEYHRVLIEATIRVAQTLGMTTVAEGVETPEQAGLMERLRCDRAQGYLYSRPLPADELTRWIEAGSVIGA